MSGQEHLEDNDALRGPELAYVSQMQFEALRHALLVQQAKPNVVFGWKVWERTAQDPKMTYYLNQGVKAKLCEAIPFVNTLGTQYIAARAK